LRTKFNPAAKFVPAIFIELNETPSSPGIILSTGHPEITGSENEWPTIQELSPAVGSNLSTLPFL
jgi:hypothetical protein